jgi:predicted DNA-binding transcriptional regulator YafY
MMGRERRPTPTIERVGREALRLLRQHPHVSRGEIARSARVSGETTKRALQWLRDRGAPIFYTEQVRAWVLRKKNFALPLTEPSVEDLQAALTAAGLLRELGQDDAADRARALFEELAQQVSGEKRASFRADALSVTQSTAAVRDPRWMLELLGASRRRVVRLAYRSAWTNELVVHDVEPWQVRLHNGVLYLRGHSRTRGAVRTFRLANVESVVGVPNARPRAKIPIDPWGDEDPRYGVDEDRPGEAILRFRGPIARWIASSRWHPAQRDRWLTDSEVLERTISYRSCRELARRLASIADGLEAVEPEELRRELVALLNRALVKLAEKR